MIAEAASRRLVLLRHGRTAWNATGRAQGHADVGLDDVGHAQAGAVAPWVAGLRPARLWSSDLARARQTAAHVARTTALSVVLDRRLREYDVGERSGLTMQEFAEQRPGEHAAWQQGRYSAVPGAEDTPDVLARMLPACEEAVSGLAEGESAVVVTHGAALRASVVALLAWPQDQARRLRVLDNCAAAVLERGAEAGSWRLAGWNLGPGGPDFASPEGAG